MKLTTPPRLSVVQKLVFSSHSRKELHHLVGVIAVTRCGSSSSFGSHLKVIIGGLLKMSQTVTVSYFSHSKLKIMLLTTLTVTSVLQILYAR
jgi:hypothetical protein